MADMTTTTGTTPAADWRRHLATRAVPWMRGLIGVAVFLLPAGAAGLLGIISRSALPLTSTSQASTGSGDLTAILAATIWAGILGLLLVQAQRRLLRWHHARLGETE